MLCHAIIIESKCLGHTDIGEHRNFHFGTGGYSFHGHCILMEGHPPLNDFDCKLSDKFIQILIINSQLNNYFDFVTLNGVNYFAFK